LDIPDQQHADHFLSRKDQNFKSGQKTLEWSTIIGRKSEMSGFDNRDLSRMLKRLDARMVPFATFNQLLAEQAARDRGSPSSSAV